MDSLKEDKTDASSCVDKIGLWVNTAILYSMCSQSKAVIIRIIGGVNFNELPL